ncbi:MAG: Polysaccharide biosynthesis/export protein [Verrucomicrobiales bacterium]|nr:Polysaccharide biosynthesis/export protein [Verrucomicrobiales bacterium]
MISMLRTLPRYAIAALFCATILFCGCATIGQPAGTAKEDGKGAPSVDRIPLRVGDTVKVVLVPPSRAANANQPQDHKVTVKEDGTIALPYFPAIPAAGKTTKELEEIIYQKYVPDYYKSLGVTVEPDARFFYVTGEVIKGERKEYIGAMTVTRAIASCGGFTEYANKKKVILTRADGTIIKVNWFEATETPKKDPQVYPGDTVDVKRRWL